MKVAIVFVLLFATVLSLPVRKVSDSSESSEEVARQPAAAPVQNAVAAAAASSDESKESSDEDMQAAAVEVKSGSADTPSASDTASVNSQDSEDSDDDDADESETEDDGDDASHSSESGESSTPAPATVIPVVVTEEPVAETTSEPILPTIVTDTDTGRGDSLGGYPSDYKSIVYVEDKSYHKLPAPYKSYEFYGTGKKMAYDMTDGNEVEKTLPVYKVQALQIHSDLLEEDTSTPEVENQGMDASQDQEITPRQAALPEEESTSTSDVTIGDGSASDATTSESSSATEEEEEEEESASTTSDSASASQESEDEESQSSEEATATPGAADSDSDESDSAESDSDEEGAGPDTATDATTDMPVVITAK